MSNWLLGSTTFPPDFGRRDILNMKHQRLIFLFARPTVLGTFHQSPQMIYHVVSLPSSLPKQHSPSSQGVDKIHPNQPPKPPKKNCVSLSPIQGAGFINKARARCSLTFLGIGAVWSNHSPPTITTCQKDSPGMLLGKEVWSFRSFFWSKNIIISHFQTLNIYGIFAYINHKFMGKCIPYIHGASGSGFSFYIKVQLESID